MATPRGFEPLISTVTGWRVRPLHHGAILKPPKSSRDNILCQTAVNYFPLNIEWPNKRCVYSLLCGIMDNKIFEGNKWYQEAQK